jgi:hypothetical protein
LEGCHSSDSGYCRFRRVGVASPNLQFRLRPLLCLLDGDKHDIVALHVPLTPFVFHPVLHWVIMLVDSSGSARALPP